VSKKARMFSVSPVFRLKIDNIIVSNLVKFLLNVEQASCYFCFLHRIQNRPVLV
jgi:hypothetical protein